MEMYIGSTLLEFNQHFYNFFVFNSDIDKHLMDQRYSTAGIMQVQIIPKKLGNIRESLFHFCIHFV